MSFVLRTSDGREFPLGEVDRVRIGSHAHCEVSLPASSGLSPVHAELKRTGGRWLLEGVGDALVRVNQQAATGMAWLEAGAKIEIVGTNVRLSFVEAGPAANAPAPVETVKSNSPSHVSLAVPLAISVFSLLLLGGGLMWWINSSGKSNTSVASDGTLIETKNDPKTSPPAHQTNDPNAPVLPPSTTSVTNAVTSSTAAEPPVGGIVWIGLWDDRLSMLCSGWVASPERIISLGQLSIAFQEAQKRSAKLIVYCPGQAAPMITVKSVNAHPDWENPDYDLAELVPETPLHMSTVCKMADSSHLRAITDQTQLRGIGYEIPLRTGEAAEEFNQLRPPERSLLPLKLKDARSVPGEKGAPTFVALQNPDQKRQAWAVIDPQGAVIGTWIFRANGEHRIIPIDRLPKAAGSSRSAASGS